MTVANRIPVWGLASVVLLVGDSVVGVYNGYQLHYRQPALFSNATSLQVCAIVQFAAALCAVIAIRRGGSRWWSVVVVLAVLIGLSCYFGEV